MRHVLLFTGEDGFVGAEYPSLPGQFSQSETKADAITKIKKNHSGLYCQS